MTGLGLQDDALPLEVDAEHDRHLLLVAEARGLGWSACAAGIRCGFGTTTEVFSVDGPTGAVERLGVVGPEELRIPFLGLGAGVVVEPKIAGLRIYRAEVLP